MPVQNFGSDLRRPLSSEVLNRDLRKIVFIKESQNQNVTQIRPELNIIT
jgi:hypothetical protein